MKDSLFGSFVRAFLRVAGGLIAIIVVFMLFSALVSSNTGITTATQLKVLPNADWKMNPFSRATPTILRVNIDGVIGLNGTTAERVMTQLVESTGLQLKEGQVKGILLTVDSPGGGADTSDSIYRALQEYKSRYKVPIHVYADGLCASGGMYIACAADKIYATPDTLVGSVGVVTTPFFNFVGLMDKLGIASKTITAGKDKDPMNPFREWRPDEAQPIQHIVEACYDRFTSIVSKSRPLLTRQVLEELGAQVYPANEAKELGYIDGVVESRDEALLALAKELGIEDNYQFIELEISAFWGALFGSDSDAAFGKFHHYIRFPGDLHPDLYGKLLYLWQPQ